MEWKKGKIKKIIDKHGKAHYHFIYNKKNGKEGDFELNVQSEDIREIFEKQPEIEAKWKDKNDFEIRFEGKEYKNISQRKNIVETNRSESYDTHRRSNNANNDFNFGNAYFPLADLLKDRNEFDSINRNLLLNRYILYWKKEKGNLKLNKKEHFMFIENIRVDKEIIRFVQKKQEKNIEKLKKVYGDENIKTIDYLSLKSRLIVGIGNPSPAETGLLLHHIYGVPYIPGTALKGITRWSVTIEIGEEIKKSSNLDIYKIFKMVNSYIENDEFEKKLQNDGLKLSSNIVDKIKKAQKIFGTKSSAGTVIFLDAFPDENVRFKVDIMNPHYPKYYDSAKEPPADWQNPTPIPFLTVEVGKFDFILVFTKKASDDHKKLAEDWLKKALENFGVGAKTALGYGIFKE